MYVKLFSRHFCTTYRKKSQFDDLNRSALYSERCNCHNRFYFYLKRLEKLKQLQFLHQTITCGIQAPAPGLPHLKSYLAAVQELQQVLERFGSLALLFIFGCLESSKQEPCQCLLHFHNPYPHIQPANIWRNPWSTWKLYMKSLERWKGYDRICVFRTAFFSDLDFHDGYSSEFPADFYALFSTRKLQARLSALHALLLQFGKAGNSRQTPRVFPHLFV
ncbi:hypothetical protein TcasGA2_TC012673 [Tribolium castaneum]|uniref:Uncharacterized protein n=1 Tax=Tribolium castaneum TaxID=7070 RepID=D6WZI0_TRICA|nr:hypothetical protein TcasGA2_TC012673 [Tribolium castaneum]